MGPAGSGCIRWIFDNRANWILDPWRGDPGHTGNFDLSYDRQDPSYTVLGFRYDPRHGPDLWGLAGKWASHADLEYRCHRSYGPVYRWTVE